MFQGNTIITLSLDYKLTVNSCRLVLIIILGSYLFILCVINLYYVRQRLLFSYRPSFSLAIYENGSGMKTTIYNVVKVSSLVFCIESIRKVKVERNLLL